MLPEVVRTWPDLVLLGAVGCGAHVRFAGIDLVDTFLVSVQVVQGGETHLPGAACYVARVFFVMAKSVFAVPCQP